MKKTLLTLVLSLIGILTANAQVGIGTTSPDASAQLELQSSEKGFLPPRMDTDARNGISSPADGLTIYNTDEKCLQWYNGSGWFNACDGSLFVPAGPISDCVDDFIPPFLSADDTEVVDVTNPATGKTWMDRNLGAYTADRTTPSAAGGTDCWAYGNLYQWGRGNDGHEDRTSSDIPGPVTAGNEGSSFIKDANAPYDWLSSPDDDRWNANETSGGAIVKTTNDPCPDGYRVPTKTELTNERDSWTQNPINSTSNRAGAINSPLKLPVAGNRSRTTGELKFVGSNGYYWSSTDSGGNSDGLYYGSSYANVDFLNRPTGASMRCIKE